MKTREARFTNVGIDRVRSYWDARPCNIRHSTQPLGSREYFQEVAARKYRVEPHIPAFADFERWAGTRVLEIGCGLGTTSVGFARAGAEVTGVDLSGASIALAQRHAEALGVADRTRFLQADAEHLTDVLAGEQFDLVYSFGVIHHSPHPDRILRQARRLVQPGGELRLMVYNRWSWKVIWIVLRHGRGRFWRAASLVATHSEAQTGCPITYTYTRRSGRALVEDAGFTVDGVGVDHIFPYRIADYVEHRYVREWWFRFMPARMFRALERTLGWHLLLRAHREGPSS
jgi:2-polyprenyl-3-methyl-5-hydroxy-6-metoxy-1,4-benzoquinol methylase